MSKRPWILLVACLIVLAFPPIIAYIFWGFYCDIWRKFWFAYMPFAGTIVLGGISLYQNYKAEQINCELIKVQDFAYTPAIDIGILEKDTDLPSMWFGINSAESTETYKLKIRNISDVVITNITIVSLYAKENRRNPNIIDIKHIEATSFDNFLDPQQEKIMALSMISGFKHLKGCYKIKFELSRIDGSVYTEHIEFDFEPFTQKVSNRIIKVSPGRTAISII